MTEQQVARLDFEAFVESEKKPASVQQIEIWHKDAVKVAAGYRRCEFRLVELLKNMSQCEGYLLYDCDSLTRYARFCLQLPENTIRDFVTVANKAKEVPQIIDALKENKATVSKLRKVCPVLKSDDYVEWLELVEECSAREIERVVAMQKPETLVEDRMSFVGPNLLELKIGIPEELSEKLERIQDLVCSKTGSVASLAETLAVMAEIALEQLDPLRKAERALKRKVAQENKARKASEPGNAKFENSRWANKQTAGGLSFEKTKTISASRAASSPRKLKSKRKPLSATIIHAVQLRDKDQCAHRLPNGARCPNRRWLHLHHIKPVAHGGLNSLENLALVCSAHHRMHHRLNEQHGARSA